MMVFQYYEYFYKVAQSGNITRAAQELQITQPALSKAMANLEQKMGCKLFCRSQKGVRLTLEGELLFQNVKKTFSMLNETQARIQQVQNSAGNIIRIGCGRDLLERHLMAKLTVFRRQCPDTKLRISLLSTPEIEKGMIDDQLDIGVTTQQIQCPHAVSHPLFPLHDCFIVGEKYRQLLGNRPMSIYQLLNYPLIMLPQASATRSYQDALFASYGLVANPSHELQETRLISLFVQNDFGIGIVTENFVRPDLDAGLVYKIPTAEELPPRTAWLNCSGSTNLSQDAQQLIRFLLDPSEE